MRGLLKSNSKRLKVSIIFVSILLIIGLITLYTRPNYLNNMAVYIVSTTLPLIAYIIGESFRPSVKSNN